MKILHWCPMLNFTFMIYVQNAGGDRSNFEARACRSIVNIQYQQHMTRKSIWPVTQLLP